VLGMVAVWQWVRRVLLFLGNRRIDKAGDAHGVAKEHGYCTRRNSAEIPSASNRPARRYPNRAGCPSCKSL
jgi:hypothetical protein